MALALPGGLSAPRRRVLPARRRRRPLPRQLEPRAVEMAYARELRAFVAVAREAVKQHVLPALPSLLQQAAVERGDEAELELHLDASAAQVRRLMGETRDALSRATNERQLQRLAEDMGNRTSTFQKAQLDKQVRAAVGVDVFVGEPHLGPLAEAFVETNVALIKSLPETAFGQVETLIHQAMRSGQRHEELADAIAERFDVAESRATLIARDQTLKYFGELNKARQQGLGVEAYVWRTSGDARVREAHEAREGKRFLWSEPPADGHPGQAILCRCSAEPDFESALEALVKEEVPPAAKPKRVRTPKPPPPPPSPEPVVLPPPPPPPPPAIAEEPVRISGPHGAALARRQPMLNRVFGPKLEVMDEEAGKRLDAIALIPEKLLKALEPKMDFIRAGKGGVGSVDPNVAAMGMSRIKDKNDKDQRTAEEVGGVFYEHTKTGKRLAPGSFARAPSQLLGRVVIGTVEGNAKQVVVHELGHAVDIMLTKSSLGETEFRKAWQEWRNDKSYAGWHKDYFTNDSYGHKEAFADIFDRYYVAGKADAVAVYGERLVKAVEADIARVLDANG